MYRLSTAVYGPPASTAGWTWIGDERIAIGALPLPGDLAGLAEDGVTHVVNCRARLQNVISQDLWVQRTLLGPERVGRAPMWDTGHRQAPWKWAPAACFAADTLAADPTSRVLIHCQQGRRRSALVAYAVLRLRGHASDAAARLILEHRPVTRIVPAYRASVERWLGRLPESALQ